MLVAFFAVALLATIWVGYPAVIAVLAILRSRSQVRWNGALPRVTVVLASREPADQVRARVDDLLSTTYPPDLLEVVVSIDSSVPPTDEFRTAIERPRVRVITGDHPGGKAMSINAAVRLAGGELLVFADTAQRFAPDVIPRLVDALGDARVGAVSGRLVMEGPASRRSLAEWYWSLERRLRRNEARVYAAVGVTGAIYAMRRALFTPLPPGLILDDLYNPMRLVLAGHRIAYDDGALAFEPRRFAIAGERRRKVRTLTGVWQLCRWLPGVLLPWRNPIWAQFVFHKLLRFASPFLTTLALLGVSWWLVVRARASNVPLWWMVLGVAAVAGVLALVRPIRRAGWEAIQLHAALVEASVNGVRGRWDVW